ncbi:hypothetical protein BOX15_Mlig015336g1, partial [Macrostomum lignano]
GNHQKLYSEWSKNIIGDMHGFGNLLVMLGSLSIVLQLLVAFGSAVDLATTKNQQSGASEDSQEELETQANAAQLQAMEANPDPYKHHAVHLCSTNLDCLAMHGGCSHDQYIGDSEAKQETELLPKCYQPHGLSTRGVCLCTECSNDLHCHRQSRCPHSLTGQCVSEHSVKTCRCGQFRHDYSKMGGSGSRERSSVDWNSLLDYLICRNILLRRLLSDSVQCS